MLTRVADSLYWLGRNVERAETIARVLDVSAAAATDLYSLGGGDRSEHLALDDALRRLRARGRLGRSPRRRRHDVLRVRRREPVFAPFGRSHRAAPTRSRSARS